jgi:uncharacterized DUF497 family protein
LDIALSRDRLKYVARNGVFFTWDEEKYRVNVKLHDCVTFELAAEALGHCLKSIDVENIDGEERITDLGQPSLSYKAILRVTYTERKILCDDNVELEGLRIISARIANRYEEGEYHAECSSIF